MVQLDEYTLLQNWIAYNKKLAKLVQEQQEKENKKLAENTRVSNLKAVWENDGKICRGAVSTKPQGVRVLDLKAVWNREFKDKKGGRTK